jgi:hypothetical protein
LKINALKKIESPPPDAGEIFGVKNFAGVPKLQMSGLISGGTEKNEEKIPKLFSAPSDNSYNGGSTAAAQHRTNQG